MHQRIINL